MNLRDEFMDDEEIDMSPMIDMVFLLIIFFMVASHMTKMDNPEILMPIAKNAVVPELEMLDGRRSLTVQRSESGGIVYYLGNRAVELKQIRPTLEKLVKENPKLQVYLRADRSVPHKHVRNAMQQCVSANIIDIIFATLEKDPGRKS